MVLALGFEYRLVCLGTGLFLSILPSSITLTYVLHRVHRTITFQFFFRRQKCESAILAHRQFDANRRAEAMLNESLRAICMKEEGQTHVTTAFVQKAAEGEPSSYIVCLESEN